MTIQRIIPWFILAVGTIFFWKMALVEAPIVASYWQNPDVGFRDFMDQSIFEGEGFGGSDIGVSIAILGFLAWLWAIKSKKFLKLLSPIELKFIWLSSLINGLLIVHSLKWLISRARPRIALTPDMPLELLSSIEWPGFMPWNGPRGANWNSFPSGHAASCAIMLTIVYIAWPRSRTVGMVLFVLIAVYSYFMGIARSMAGMHWLSDSIASFFLTWICTHLLASRMGIIENQCRKH